jgi:cysteine-rich repeat protein
MVRRKAWLGNALFVLSTTLLACSGSSEVAPPESFDTGTDGDEDSDPAPVCGNGIKEGSELCDDGNKTPGDGCEEDCTWTCKAGTAEGDKACSDSNPCNGEEKCGTGNKCETGMALGEGASCGTGKMCKTGLCVDITCGDSVTTAPEECDDGNVDNGDGCDSCKFSCVSTDTTRNCASADACKNNGTCDDASHKCSAGTAKADGTACGSGMICKAGVCGGATCGDGIVSGTEQCDFGTANGAGTGCEVDCKFSCAKTPADSCLDTNPCNGTEVCANVTVSGGTGQKCNAGTALAEGTACGGGKICKSGACVTPPPVTCGNGTLDTGEDCDFGTGNGPGTGCEATCKFSCSKTADTCSDGNVCNGVEACQTVTVSGKTGQKCAAGTNAAKCIACGTGLCDGAGACKSSTCGDTCVDAAKLEQCEPPSTTTCDATCKTIVAAVCGNGKRETGEQCDDGNTANLDGCDSVCKFEQDHRANSLDMQFGTDTFCTANQLGSAIASAGQSTVRNSLTTGVNDGSTNVLFKFLGLEDLTGTADPAIILGGLSGKPVAAPTGVTYNGASDLDWWYTVDPTSIDGSRNPPAAAQIAGKIVSKALTAGPGNMTIMLTFSSGASSPLSLSNVNIKATIGTTSKPLTSTGTTPGHLASENLDPTLVSFATMSNGQLCGNVSAYSLSKVPIPKALVDAGVSHCSQNYALTNSLLDVLISGCNGFLGISIINKKQPDKEDPTAPAVGSGPPYTLSASSTSTKVVDRCKSGTTTYNAGTAQFDECLKDAAYSSYFKFTTDRVIIK